MIRISKKVDYAIIVLAHLALHRESPASARRIARAYDISYALVANLLKRLVAAEWVMSLRGVRGGYLLVKSPQEITLDELIATIEGPYRFADCAATNDPNDCPTWSLCPARPVMQRVHNDIRDTLKSVTVAELAGIGPRLGGPVPMSV